MMRVSGVDAQQANRRTESDLFPLRFAIIQPQAQDMS